MDALDSASDSARRVGAGGGAGSAFGRGPGIDEVWREGG